MSLLVRTAGSPDAVAIGRVHAEGWRLAFEGQVPEALLNARTAERHTREWADWLASNHLRQVVYVAEDPVHGIVGFVRVAAAEENEFGARGEILNIHVLPVLHGQGVGRRLVTAGGSWLAEHGLDPVIIWTPRSNSYRGFYGTLGGHLVGERQRSVDGHPVDEVAYLWMRAEDLKSEAARGVPAV